MENIIAIVANIAAIATAIVAVSASTLYVGMRWRRKQRLEAYLLRAKGEQDSGRRTVLHLMTNLGMTEAQVLEAAFASKCVRASPGVDERGRADAIFFEYTTGDAEQDMALEGLLDRKAASRGGQR